jgi:hypothetical protein
LAAASQIFLHSPDTIRSMAARTLALMRLGGPMSTGTGWSRAASARLAGIGGVTFFMIGIIVALADTPQRTKRHVFASGWMAPP